MTGTVLIAGAGLSGSRCAETLRARGWEGRVLLVGDEPHAPYERPALSKQLLAGERHDIALRPDAFWAEQRIELVLGRSVEKIDTRHRTATIGAEHVDWDALVVATGVRARRLDGPPGVHHLRTLDDARGLREELSPNARVVVVGAGFIGGEVASTLSGMVGSVTVVEPAATPLERVLGPEVGALLAARYRAHGVSLRLETGVEGFSGGARVTAVRLSDGGVLPADIVVVGIGSVGEFVEVDACGRSATPSVFACGDVASWYHNGHGRRVEHWTSASGQARAVAAAITGAEEPHVGAPYFWSDQFGLRLQHVGHAESWHAVALDGDECAFTARYHDREGMLLAGLAANRTAEVASLRRELAA
jgi:3-phenylpropionate/trans-cinnamate dioxygenase ferredoxin reductase component